MARLHKLFLVTTTQHAHFLYPFGFGLPLSRPRSALFVSRLRDREHLGGLHRHQEIIVLPHNASQHTGNGPTTKRSDGSPQRLGRRLAAHRRAACRGVYSGRELARWATLWLLRYNSSRRLADAHADIASINAVASDMADDMMSFYLGDQPGHTPGLLPQPYYCKSCPRVLFLYRPPWLLAWMLMKTVYLTRQGGRAVP